MDLNMHKKKGALFIIIALISFTLLFSMIESKNVFSSHSFESTKITEQENIHLSSVETISEQWLKNSNFSTQQYWESKIEGDDRDVEATISDDQASYIIIGDLGVLSIDDPLSGTDWTASRNSELPVLPDLYEINSSGCYVYHQWHEDINQTRNRPSVHWTRNINMPVNMTDYIITSASLEVIFNATVTVSPHSGGGIDREGDIGLDAYSTGDYAEFYVLLSDVEETFEPILIAYNNTGAGNLGQDNPPIGSYSDSPLTVIPESVLIGILTSILEHDGHNFTITLGIDIYCEDNEIGVDIDRWNSLIIRSFNLTFTYEKKIDKLTSISWQQVGKAIPVKNVQIKDTYLNFSCKINQTWPENLPSNSEVRILINNNLYRDPIKLTTLITTFQTIKINGSDFISLFQKNTNITLSIQIFLLDTFSLNQNITISIDDVFLKITYIVVTLEYLEEAWLFLLLFIIACILGASIATYFILYYEIFRFPKPVRKVRKYKKTLSHKKDPDVFILSQENAFNRAYNYELAQTLPILRIKSPNQKEMPTIKKTPSLEQKQSPENLESDQLIKKSIEKKEELDEIVDKALKK